MATPSVVSRAIQRPWSPAARKPRCRKSAEFVIASAARSVAAEQAPKMTPSRYVVELPVREQDQRAGERQGEARARQDDAEPDDVVGARLALEHRCLARQVACREAEPDAGDRAPDDREGDHQERLVLVEVDVPEVDDEEERDRDRGRDERQRIETKQAENDDPGTRREERHPEGAHVGARQVREDRRDEARQIPALVRVGGEPAPTALERLPAAHAVPLARNLPAALRARDLRRLHSAASLIGHDG